MSQGTCPPDSLDSIKSIQIAEERAGTDDDAGQGGPGMRTESRRYRYGFLEGATEFLFGFLSDKFHSFGVVPVDDLCAQTFSPLEGKHWYTAFLGMEPKRTHRVRIIKETMPFFDGSKAVLLRGVSESAVREKVS